MNGSAPAWIWGLGAAAFYALLLIVHPRRAGILHGYRFARAHPKTWLLVGLANAYPSWLAARHGIKPAIWPDEFLPLGPMETSHDALLQSARSLCSTLYSPVSPELFSGLFALALLFNYLGVRATFQRGCHLAFGKGRIAAVAYWLILTAALCQLATLVLHFMPLDQNALWQKAIATLGALFGAASVVCILGWLLRFMETFFRAPDEILETRWVAAASGRSARLWPVVLVLAGWLILKVWWQGTIPPAVGISLTALALTAAFLPFLLLHWRGHWGWRPALHRARLRLMRHFHDLVGWIFFAFLHFYLFHLADLGLSAAFEAGSALLLGWKTLAAFVFSTLLVWMLASWTAIQCGLFPEDEPAPEK